MQIAKPDLIIMCLSLSIVQSILSITLICMGTAVAQWLKCCATNQKVAGSIPDCVIGIFR